MADVYDLFSRSRTPNDAYLADGMRPFWLDCECPDGAEPFTHNTPTSAAQSFLSVSAVVNTVSDNGERATAHAAKVAAAAIQVPHGTRQWLDHECRDEAELFRQNTPISAAQSLWSVTLCMTGSAELDDAALGRWQHSQCERRCSGSTFDGAKSITMPVAQDICSQLCSSGVVDAVKRDDGGAAAHATKVTSAAFQIPDAPLLQKSYLYDIVAQDGRDDNKAGALKPAEAAAILEKNAAPETELQLPPRPLRFTDACGQLYYERSSGNRRRVRGPAKDVWKPHGGRKSQGRLFTSQKMATLMIRTFGSVFDSNSRKRGRYIAFTSVKPDGSNIGTVWQVQKPHSDEDVRPQKNQKLRSKTSENE